MTDMPDTDRRGQEARSSENDETREGTFDGRPEFVSQDVLNDEAADVFVRAMGWANADYLTANLRLTVRQSDALRAIDYALVRNFNIVRQEQIREANRRGR